MWPGRPQARHTPTRAPSTSSKWMYGNGNLTLEIKTGAEGGVGAQTGVKLPTEGDDVVVLVRYLYIH